ncbi:MAG TPA: acyl-CoA dehydrogenase family protein [Anaerolineae bacterium]|nr:acyl-CoA dehydrogenase family protein [Anaerolineae bacterium]
MSDAEQDDWLPLDGSGREKRGWRLIKPGMASEPIEAGRNALAVWQEQQPDNYFTADGNLQRTLNYYWGDQTYQKNGSRLYKFGGQAATTVNRLARLSNQAENLPQIVNYNSVGQRLAEIAYHPTYHEAGRLIYGSGVMSVLAEPGNNLLSQALFYLSAQNGEAGHNCPLACTAGLIKALQKAGSTHLQETYLPPLLDDDYDNLYHGAQFITEIQGGSDVGANGTVATPLDPAAEGSWLLNGEKWFCSNVSADVALVTARVMEQGEGTKGLGLFLVPKVLADGRPNGMYIRRLKDKLGTRSLATAEVHFEDAVAYQVGETHDGIRHTMNHVINTSRLFNAVGATGNARRAYVVAWSYAQHRFAFGRAIAYFPLVQDLLGRMRAETMAMLSGSMHLVHLWDKLELGELSEEEQGFFRIGLNLNKYRTAVLAHDVIQKGIEVLGGNGTIEDFSVLPRLLRDNIVYENWEGTHNVLMAQVQRDMRRHKLDKPFLAYLAGMWGQVQHPELREAGETALGAIEEELASIFELDELNASIYFRPLMTRAIDLFYAACLALEGEWEMSRSKKRPQQKSKIKLRAAHFYMAHWVERRPAKEIVGYTDVLGHLCAGI